MVRPRMDASSVLFKGASPNTCPARLNRGDVARTGLSHSREDRHPVTLPGRP